MRRSMASTLSAPPDPLGRRLAAFRQESRVRAGSLIISLFGDAVLPRGGRIWLGSLIRLLQPLGVSERLVRTSVYRLAKDEWLQAESRGRRADYLLTDSGRQRFEEAARLIYAARAPRWDRRWRFVLVVGELPAREREALRRALFWHGFGMLGSDCFVHPGADLQAVFDDLVVEGLGPRLGCLMPMLAQESGAGGAADAAALVRRAWNLEELAAAYAGFVAAYEPIRAQLEAGAGDGPGDEVAFLLRLLLIHDYRRLLLRDPGLPDVLLPPAWPGRQARSLCRDLYRRLLAPSERHLENRMRLADGSVPAAVDLAARFADEGEAGG
ncbi:MAG: padR [Rhodocyclaceae bacterium]|nr:padR [Rhodocyclaceae bacterium]